MTIASAKPRYQILFLNCGFRYSGFAFKEYFSDMFVQPLEGYEYAWPEHVIYIAAN